MINFYLLTKPGIILGNLVTLAAGFLLASHGSMDFFLFFSTLIGLAFIMASGCVLNNYIDRSIDKKMARTKNRPLVTGLISNYQAILFAIGLLAIGQVIFLSFTNLLTLAIADVGFLIYVFFYSLWKCRTVYGTAIGSLSGAIPPVVGYCAASGELDGGALILFLMMVFWQMPHFFSIAILHLDDYTAAKIPVLPIVKGMLRTKIHMVIYIGLFIITASLLTFFNYTGNLYLTITALIGLLWLGMSIKGFKITNDRLWGQSMFRISLVMIAAICFMIPFDLSKPLDEVKIAINSTQNH